MEKVKVSVVSYLNSKPFIYGLQHSDLINKIDLQLDIPSTCAQKLMDGTVDLGLIPSAMIPKLKEAHIISDYCIGAVGKVASVMLYSNVPLDKIKTILLDYQSNTSVTLVRVLAKHFWKINPDWVKASADFEDTIQGNTAAVIIGDRTFGLENKYTYMYDLAEEWQKFTALPFVFACWVSNKKLSADFIDQFNVAIKYGMDNRALLIEDISRSKKYNTDVNFYLTQSIQYEYDDLKKEGLKLFLEYCKEINQ